MYKRHYSVNSQHNTTQNRPKFDLVSECRTAHSICLHKRDNVCIDWVRERNQVIPVYQPSCPLQVHTVSVYMCIPSLSPGFPEKYWIFSRPTIVCLHITLKTFGRKFARLATLIWTHLSLQPQTLKLKQTTVPSLQWSFAWSTLAVNPSPPSFHTLSLSLTNSNDDTFLTAHMKIRDSHECHSYIQTSHRVCTMSFSLFTPRSFLSLSLIRNRSLNNMSHAPHTAGKHIW